MDATTPDVMPLISFALGLGLAAAAGLRVFVPLLALGLASRHGYVELSAGFQWLASSPALIAFGTATVVEVVAYHVPFLDHLLDVIATPSAPATMAILAGGGAAGMVQSATVLARVGSTTFTGGLGNVLLASFELFGAIGTVVLAIALPLVALVLVLAMVVAAAALVRRFAQRASGSGSAAGAG